MDTIPIDKEMAQTILIGMSVGIHESQLNENDESVLRVIRVIESLYPELRQEW